MKFEVTVFGAKILETITSGLYDGNLNCLREYVLNSLDAESKNVKLYFENNGNDLVICDNGRGMNEDDLKRALSVGWSYKTPEEAGWRGIGIWSGVPACTRILLTTKKADGKKLKIEINCEKLREGYGTNRPAIDVLSESTGEIEETALTKEESTKDHFTIVRLNSILPTQKPIFRGQAIREYLSRVVPAPFDNKQFSPSHKIEEFLKKNGVKLPDVKIEFEGVRTFRPPYRSDIYFQEPVFKEFMVGGELLAVGWFLTTNRNTKLRDPNKGIFFKKKGFTIGDEYLVENLSEEYYSEWQYGEIHIVTDRIKENAAKSNFEANSEVIQPLFDQVGEFVNALQGMNRYQAQKIQSKRIEKANDLLDKGDIKSAKSYSTKAMNNIASKRSFPSEPSLQVMKPIIDAKSNQDKAALVDLENKLKLKKPEEELIAKKKERLKNVVDHLPLGLRDHCAKLTLKGKLEPEMSLLDPLVELLKEKTGSTDNELRNLSRFAYGWKDIVENAAPRVLTITGLSEDVRDKRRNLELGIMISALQDLFVHPKKHALGKDSFKWFESLSEAEKFDVMTELIATIGLVCRMVEKSEINEA